MLNDTNYWNGKINYRISNTVQDIFNMQGKELLQPNKISCGGCACVPCCSCSSGGGSCFLDTSDGSCFFSSNI